MTRSGALGAVRRGIVFGRDRRDVGTVFDTFLRKTAADILAAVLLGIVLLAHATPPV
jgi:hypothetical protein